MEQVRFGKTYVMHPYAAARIKQIHTLTERDAYVAKVGKGDPELAAGRYDWWSLPDKSMVFVTEADRTQFKQYCKRNPVRLRLAPAEYEAAMVQWRKKLLAYYGDKPMTSKKGSPQTLSSVIDSIAYNLQWLINNPAPLKGTDKEYYADLAQRAERFVADQKRRGRPVQVIGRPNLLTRFNLAAQQIRARMQRTFPPLDKPLY